jgi:hypothetical protein
LDRRLGEGAEHDVIRQYESVGSLMMSIHIPESTNSIFTDVIVLDYLS